MIDPSARDWRKSSHSSGADNCVEVNLGDGTRTVAVRHSKNREGAVLTFTGPEWRAFVEGVRDGEFDL